MAKAMVLPVGLVLHCAECGLVVPADAPALPGARCAEIVAAKLSWFDAKATLAAQFAMAAGTWSQIHYASLQAADCPADGLSYGTRVHRERKAVYAASAARQGMTVEAQAVEAAHPKYGWLHAVEG